MKERASELRGALAVRSARGRGTTVVLRLPDLLRPAPVLS
jgi:signal transduction histidine kinase